MVKNTPVFYANRQNEFSRKTITYLGQVMCRVFQTIFYVGLICCAAVNQAFAQSAPSQIDPRARQLIDHALSLKDKGLFHRDWSSHNGPWADLIQDSYVPNLNSGEKERYDKAFDNKNCSSIGKLQTIAFLRKFPNLRAAHQQEWIAKAFQRTVINTLPDIQICESWRDMEAILRFIRETNPNILPFDFSYNAPLPDNLGNTDANAKTKLIDRAMNSLCHELSLFIRYAIDRDVSRAIKYVLRLSKRSQDVRYTSAQLYYVFLRAKQLNILTRDESDRVDSLYHKVKAATRIKIERHLENPEGSTRAPSLWSRWCQYPRLSARERLSLP